MDDSATLGRGRSDRSDVIVIGGGHNGLVCAAYLAQAGLRPLVLERRNVVGGAAVTESPWGSSIKVSSLGYVLGLMPGRIMRDLRLVERGLRVHQRGPVFIPDADGGSLTLWDDPKLRYAEVARFSRRDASALPDYEAWLSGLAEIVRDLLWTTPPRLGSTRPGDLLDQLRLAWRVRGIGTRGIADLTRIFSMSVGDLLDERFESDRVKAALAIQGAAGVWGGPRDPGGAYALLHTSLGSGTDTGLVAFGHVEGGMGSVTRLVAEAVVERGGVVRTGAGVRSILTRDGAVTGVLLDSGERIDCGAIVSTAHARTTFLELLGPDQLPAETVESARRFASRGGVVKVNLALQGLPSFTSLPRDGEQPQHTGAIELMSSLDDLQEAFEQARSGRPSERPYADLNIVPSGDRSVAPEGIRVASMIAQWVPASWSDTKDPAALDAFVDTVIERYTRLAPDFKERIIHRQAIGPYEMEHEYGLVGGSTFGGEMNLHQLFHLRPTRDSADYRTPVRGLYLGGSASHPGGGVTGIPGHNAAHRVIADARRPRWRRRRGG